MFRAANAAMTLAAMGALDGSQVKRYKKTEPDEIDLVVDFEPHRFGQRLGPPRPEPVRYKNPPLPDAVQLAKIERAKAKRARKGW